MTNFNRNYETELSTASNGEVHCYGIERTGDLGNDTDRQDMARMGKRQQLSRNLSTTAIFGFCIAHSSSWVSLLSTAPIGLENGGRAGLVYSALLSWLGWMAVYTSMAELASIAPTAGAVYHWVSEFAPRKYQRILSYIVGWMIALGWQAGLALNAFVAGRVLQSLVSLYIPSYVEQLWHSVLLAVAFLTLAFVVNFFAAKQLGWVLHACLYLHVLGFLATITSLLALRNPPSPPVWTSFANPGWPDQLVSFFVGILATSAPFLGHDASAHMAEELTNASVVLPRVIIFGTICSGATLFVTSVSLCYCITNIELVLKTGTGYPFLALFYHTTQSLAGTTIMGVAIILIVWCGCLTIMTGASRQLFAFARDHALPFSEWIQRVHARKKIPLNSMLCVYFAAVLVEALGVANSAALNNIAGLGSSALSIAYIISLASLLWQKFQKGSNIRSRLDFGVAGVCCNILALIWLCLVFVFGLFPPIPTPELTYASMNWASAIWSGVLLLSIVYYTLSGRRRYVAPVEHVTRCI